MVMKSIIKLCLGFYKLIVIAVLCIMFFTEWSGVHDGTRTVTTAIIDSVVYLVIYKALMSRFVVGLLGKLFNYDPFEGIAQERRRFNAKWDAAMARKAQEQKKWEAAEHARRKATDNAIFHENQAKRYAGTNDGYWHENMAKKYRNDAKR